MTGTTRRSNEVLPTVALATAWSAMRCSATLVVILLTLQSGTVRSSETAPQPTVTESSSNMAAAAEPVSDGEARFRGGVSGCRDAGAGYLRLELAAGHTATDQEVSWASALFNLEIAPLPWLRVGAGMPMFGFSGSVGDEQFLRGNIMTDVSFETYRRPWLRAAAGLEAYWPTFEDYDAMDDMFSVNLVSASLSHLLPQAGYVLKGAYSLSAWSSARFLVDRFVFAAEVSLASAVNKNLWWIGTGAEVQGYIWRQIALGMHWQAVIDPGPTAPFMRRVLGLPRVSSRHGHLLGWMLQWTSHTGELAAGVRLPTGSDWGRVQDPYFIFSARLWMP